jgi:hypothetical protein
MVDCPWQSVVTLAFAVTAGDGFTVTTATAEEEQPPALPVTVYDVVAAGTTEMVEPEAPVVQE